LTRIFFKRVGSTTKQSKERWLLKFRELPAAARQQQLAVDISAILGVNKQNPRQLTMRDTQ